MLRITALAGTSLLAIAMANPVHAATVTVTEIQFSDSSRVITIGSAPAGAISGDVQAGRFELTTASESLFAWCVDIFRVLHRGSKNPGIVFTLGDLTDDAGTPPNPLSAEQIERVAGLVAAGDDALESSPNNRNVSAAFQAAIWETIYPSASFTSSDSTLQALIDSINATEYSGSGGTLYQRLNDRGEVGRTQTLFGGADPDPVIPVPAPGALGLFGFALAGLVIARRARA